MEVLTIDGKRYLNAKQAANAIGIARKTFYKRGLDALIPSQKFGLMSRKYFAEEDVLRYTSKRRINMANTEKKFIQKKSTDIQAGDMVAVRKNQSSTVCTGLVWKVVKEVQLLYKSQGYSDDYVLLVCFQHKEQKETYNHYIPQGDMINVAISGINALEHFDFI